MSIVLRPPPIGILRKWLASNFDPSTFVSEVKNFPYATGRNSQLNPMANVFIPSRFRSSKPTELPLLSQLHSANPYSGSLLKVNRRQQNSEMNYLGWNTAVMQPSNFPL